MEFDWTAYWAAIPVTADELDSTNENEDFAGGYEPVRVRIFAEVKVEEGFVRLNIE